MRLFNDLPISRSFFVGVPVLFIAAACGSSPPVVTTTATVETVAGNGERGYQDGPLPDALFEGPEGVAVAADGTIYVAETIAGRVRKIGPDGVVSTILSGEEVKLPHRLAVGPDDTVYVTDAGNNRVLAITPDGRTRVLAGTGEAGDNDGPGDVAQFDFPIGVAVGPDGAVYVADSGNSKVKVISPDGLVTTLAGSGERGLKDGPPDVAQFAGLNELTLDAAGNVFVTEPANVRVRRIATDGTVSTVAGSGVHELNGDDDSEFKGPAGIVATLTGTIYVADFGLHSILQVTPGQIVTTLAGDGEPAYRDGPGARASFKRPTGLALGPDGALYVADAGNHVIRKVIP